MQRMLNDRKQREQVAQGLGWFSLGVGIAEIIAPRTVSRMLGVPRSSRLMRFVGLREVVCGIGILSQPDTKFWLQARVNGGAMDLGLLSAATLSKKSDRTRLAWATAAVAAVTALDVVACRAFQEHRGLPTTLRYRKSMLVHRAPEELYRMWRNFEELPRFMKHLIAVKALDQKRSHWIAKGPAGTNIEWDAEISEDVPNKLISWRSLGNPEIDHVGSVRFDPARHGQSTRVRIELDYRPFAGRIGATIAEWFGQTPEKQIATDMLEFKKMAESGRENQPAARQFTDLLRE